MKQEMQKSIFKIQTAVETLTRQKVIDKNVYDFVHREIKSLLESVENIVEVNNHDETLLTFTDKEKYVNQHINLADTSVLCKELNRRKEIGNDFLAILTEGKNWLIMEKNVLTLTVSKQWFDMIVAGEKTEEYREIKPYWIKRLTTNCEVAYDVAAETYCGKVLYRPYIHVLFINGYRKDSPRIEKEIESISIGRPKKGMCPDKWLDTEFFVIKFV